MYVCIICTWVSARVRIAKIKSSICELGTGKDRLFLLAKYLSRGHSLINFMVLFQNSRHESDIVRTKTEPPKFYKQDLLAVLRERNELKEELDSLRDELYVTKA